MRTALVTTTIHVPTVLALLRKYDPDVHFFIVGDLKSPHDDILEFLNPLDNCSYLPPLAQHDWKCSDAIGWDCVQRRSIGFLEALRWGADVIVTWDDDNIPINHHYFYEFEKALEQEFDLYSGLQLSSPTKWHHYYGGNFNHRGFPLTVRNAGHVEHVIDAKVGVAAGPCLGDPDIDAYTRMGGLIQVNGPDEIARNGYVVAQNTHTVFNSQNTAFLRQFAPAMFMLPGVGRYDDIIASLLTQRVMRDRGYQVHIGPPFTWQQRNPHNLLNDLKDEMWGMEHVLEISDHIDRMPTMDGPPVNFVRAFYEGCLILPEQTRTAGQLWCDDIEGLKL